MAFCQHTFLFTIKTECTIDVDKTSSMTDQSFGRGQEIVEADAETNLLDHLVRIFCVDVVFYCLSRVFAKVFWYDLD